MEKENTKVYREIMNTYLGKAEPNYRYNQNYAIIISSETDPAPLPPSMQDIEFENFGVGIAGIR